MKGSKNKVIKFIKHNPELLFSKLPFLTEHKEKWNLLAAKLNENEKVKKAAKDWLKV